MCCGNPGNDQGTEHKLTSEQIAEADVVILAVDVKISGEERFKGKPGDPSGDGSSDQKCHRFY